MKGFPSVPRLISFFCLVVAFALFSFTVIHTPVPKFRGIPFEFARNFGGWVLLGWMGLTLLSLMVFLFLERTRLILLTILLGCFSSFLLFLSIAEFFDPRLSLKEDRFSAQAFAGKAPLEAIVTESRSVSMLETLVDKDTPFAWFVLNDSEEALPVSERVQCVMPVQIADGRRSRVYSSFGCDRFHLIEVKEDEHEVAELLLPNDSKAKAVRIFFFRMREVEGLEGLYQNMLALRRFAGVVKASENAIVLADFKITPWSSYYGIFTEGIPLFDFQWGKRGLTSLVSSILELNEGFQAIMFRGEVLPKSFRFLKSSSGDSAGYAAIFLVPA